MAWRILDGGFAMISLSKNVKLFVLCIVAIGVCRSAMAQEQPSYKVDAAWPKQLPNNWIMGQVSGIAVDREDHVWVMQRPGSNVKDDLAAAQSPPVSQCCFSAPPVLEFDGAGNLLKSWGGPGPGYDWPASEHSIFVDANGNVWITGNGPADRQAIKFTKDGKFLMQIGHASKAPINSLDTTLLGRPAGIEVDEKAHELYIADGYGNRRVIVFDSDTGKFKRMWGAYGTCRSIPIRGPTIPAPRLTSSSGRRCIVSTSRMMDLSMSATALTTGFRFLQRKASS